MRIIAGRFKGRRLEGPRGAAVRPTSDSLRETLFNVLGDRVEAGEFLDAFAGTGAVGLEALSRGAAQVTFVECDRRAAALLVENIERCTGDRKNDACMIVREAFERVQLNAFDIVWLDPPYEMPGLETALARAGQLVKAGGCVVLEHAKRREIADRPSGLERTRLLIAGDSALSFFAPVPVRAGDEA
jgi:16S rRNA (guanine966-N2)-methyltransferase